MAFLSRGLAMTCRYPRACPWHLIHKYELCSTPFGRVCIHPRVNPWNSALRVFRRRPLQKRNFCRTGECFYLLLPLTDVSNCVPRAKSIVFARLDCSSETRHLLASALPDSAGVSAHRTPCADGPRRLRLTRSWCLEWKFGCLAY
jgi:hypothetical protein